MSRPDTPVVGEPTTVLLARHACTAATEQGRFAGRHGADLPLSAAGRGEAAALGAGLAGLGRPGLDGPGLDGPGLGSAGGRWSGLGLPDVARPAAVVASPLRRARQTADAVAAALGLAPAEVGFDEGWAEASFGAWEGLTYAEVGHRFPAELAGWQASTAVAPPGGDALAEVAARVRSARRRVVAAHPGRTVVVVTHATCVRVAVREALAAGDAALWRTRVSPAGLTAVRYWPDGGVEVVTVNATAHLAAL